MAALGVDDFSDLSARNIAVTLNPKSAATPTPEMEAAARPIHRPLGPLLSHDHHQRADCLTERVDFN